MVSEEFIRYEELETSEDYENAWDASGISYDNTQYQLTDVKPEMFTMPFPTEDVVLNPNVASTAEPIHVDVRETYSYNF